MDLVDMFKIKILFIWICIGLGICIQRQHIVKLTSVLCQKRTSFLSIKFIKFMPYSHTINLKKP